MTGLSISFFNIFRYKLFYLQIYLFSYLFSNPIFKYNNWDVCFIWGAIHLQYSAFWKRPLGRTWCPGITALLKNEDILYSYGFSNMKKHLDQIINLIEKINYERSHGYFQFEG